VRAAPLQADPRELAGRLGLLATPGLSHRRVLDLLERTGSALAAYELLERECGRDVAAAARSEAVRRRVRRALATVHRDGIHVVGHDDAAYPRVLHQCLRTEAPVLLFARGRIELLAAASVAVVGCRNATEYGLDIAGQIGAGVARAGGCVVSGVARGIDAAAQTAALDAGGPSIGVLGCGVDVYYPRENVVLQDRLAEEGLLISELLPGEPPRRHQFPHRNRIIAALSRAVVVVEAGERSGAVTTANHAAERGVEVFGVMNAMHLSSVQGVLDLLRDGARPFTGVRDLLEDVGLVRLGEAEPAPPPETSIPVGGLHGRVWQALDVEPVQVDQLAGATRLPVARLLAVLLELELDGYARQFAGQRFARVPRRSGRG
jgi:DNA processing protein